MSNLVEDQNIDGETAMTRIIISLYWRKFVKPEYVRKTVEYFVEKHQLQKLDAPSPSVRMFTIVMEYNPVDPEDYLGKLIKDFQTYGQYYEFPRACLDEWNAIKDEYEMNMLCD